ncbi:electron transfer flavoprotein subunit beta/FixA family protein [Salibacter sp.]|uniref:electron transfer flavoprotein subunit beta/FixA family protein n=1 Tax=Salibacter sp. TaxID=2010995 RepID=UPI002870360A|nr:electron transfer flavoprotein subunit beta/FixA family protein [Salibacter sp.]MDR9397817.1 electron transfer flavoprotein subunit beta/FixA family protein [Salibacter sp.]MDR9487100.1 electron transfer flavoprotein subunit beta/FixA family protein [Salibacter sp.]
MKILVGISKAPDTTTKIKFTNDNKEFDESGVQYIVNPYDEWYALVRGIEVKEAQGGSVTTITVGKEDVDPIIRKALAVGADDAVRIDSEPKDAYHVASQIANYAKENDYDMVLLGKETINYNGSQVGGMVAEIMDLPYISNASKMDLDGNKATIVRDIQGGKETLEVETPFVLSAAKGMAEQRIPNMRGIMAARSKKLEVVEPVDAEELTEVVSYALPPEKGDVKLVDPENVEELVELLHKEAKVI